MQHLDRTKQVSSAGYIAKTYYAVGYTYIQTYIIQTPADTNSSNRVAKPTFNCMHRGRPTAAAAQVPTQSRLSQLYRERVMISASQDPKLSASCWVSLSCDSQEEINTWSNHEAALVSTAMGSEHTIWTLSHAHGLKLQGSNHRSLSTSLQTGQIRGHPP